MNALLEEFLAVKKTENLSPNTINYYEYSINKMVEYAGRKGVSKWQKIKSKHVDGFIIGLKRRGYAFRTRERHIINVRAFLRWLASEGKILSDPSRHVIVPKRGPTDSELLKPPLSEKQVTDLFDSMPRASVLDLRNILILELMYSAGLRKSEVLGLETRDYDLRKGQLQVRKGKGRKHRSVPIMGGLRNAIKDYIVLRRDLLKSPDHGALLLTQRGTAMQKSNIDALFKKLNSRSAVPGCNLHPHLLRHSIAVHYLRAGMDLRYIQFFLGHESLESTRIYLRLVPEDLRAAYDAAMPEIPIKVL